MRKVYDTNGNDVTSTVSSFLQANRTLYMCDLMMLSSWIWWYPGLSPQYMNFYFSFGDFPVEVGYAQMGPGSVQPIQMYGSTQPATFIPQPLDRDKFDYGVGFSSNTTDVTWYTDGAVVVVGEHNRPWLFGPLVTDTWNAGTPNQLNWNWRYYINTGPGQAPVSLPVTPGKRIGFNWLGGEMTIHTGVNPYTDPLGYRGTDGTTFGVFPGAWVGQYTNWESCIGAFADSTGALVVAPFLVGCGTEQIVPARATQLLLGTNNNDDWTQGNGVWIFNVTGVDGTVSNPQPSWQQGFSVGMFDECNVNLYRAYFNGDPKQGGSLLGTSLMFRGFIRESEAAQSYVKLTLSSLLDLFQEVQVPTQLVQPGNRTTPYVPSGISYTVNGLNTSLSTQSTLAFNNTLPSPPADHALEDAYLLTGGQTSWTPVNNTPPPVFLRIRDNVTTGGVLYVYLYEPTIIPITNLGSTIAILLQKPLSNSYGAPGFPSVPPPEIGI